MGHERDKVKLVYPGWTPEAWLSRLRYMESVCDVPEYRDRYRRWGDKLADAIKTCVKREDLSDVFLEA